jgi:hypothetical protein
MVKYTNMKFECAKDELMVANAIVTNILELHSRLTSLNDEDINDDESNWLDDYEKLHAHLDTCYGMLTAMGMCYLGGGLHRMTDDMLARR